MGTPIPQNNGWRSAAAARRRRNHSATAPIPRLAFRPPNERCRDRRNVKETQRFRVEAGASACCVSPPAPNNMEKTMKTDALGESSVTPNRGEISKRVFLDGFHATVGPMTHR